MFSIATSTRATGRPDDAASPRLLGLVAGLTAVVLILTASTQLVDSNFYTLWEATALLAGDHPYRDFYEWGVPLPAAVSAITQVLVGHRLIGEFLVQWLFIVLGTVMSFHLGIRLSHSVWASLGTTLIALAILTATPTFHSPKLLFYPLAIWLAWRYLDRPSAGRGAALGLATAVAFLFRHDHGVYIGAAAVLACALARCAAPSSRNLRSVARDGAAFAATVAVILTPWLILVHTSEGLEEYVRLRAYLYEEWSARSSPYRWLRSMNPVRALSAEELPPPKAARVSFEWVGTVDPARRDQLERQHGLRWRQGPDANGRWQYDVSNVFDAGLLELEPYVTHTDDFNWSLLRASRSWLPAPEHAQTWLFQVSLVLPLLLLAGAGLDLLRRWWRAESVPHDTYRIILAAAFLAIIESRLFRETSYFVVVAPLTAAFSARLLAGPERVGSDLRVPDQRVRLGTLFRLTGRALAFGVLFVTSVAAIAYMRESGILQPLELIGDIHPTFAALLVSPPIDGYAPPDAVPRYDRTTWSEADHNAKMRVLLRYVHDCTRPGDRLLVTGSTPYDVGYYAERSIAGGHLFWHHVWRSDPSHEMQSLTMLQRQSVPFAISTTDPVLDDFKRYPRIRDHLVQHYVALDGAEGLLLVDTRRQPTGTFGALGFPCFR